MSETTTTDATAFWREQLTRLSQLDADSDEHGIWQEDSADWNYCAIGVALALDQLEEPDQNLNDAVEDAAPDLFKAGEQFSTLVQDGFYTGAIDSLDVINTAIQAHGGPEACRQKILKAIPKVRIQRAAHAARSCIGFLKTDGARVPNPEEIPGAKERAAAIDRNRRIDEDAEIRKQYEEITARALIARDDPDAELATIDGICNDYAGVAYRANTIADGRKPAP